MKAVILAGGLGTRLMEETNSRPKPMVEIGGMPILWHIMKIYSHHGINDFVICCGHKGYVIKEYFANYLAHTADITYDFAKNQTTVHQKNTENWRVTVVDTGENTMTGGRLRRVAHYLPEGEDFCMTYGDGLSDVNLKELIKFHSDSKAKATLVAAQPPARYGVLELSGNQVNRFKEKPESEEALINGGFFVLSKEVIPLIAGDSTVWEKEPLESLASSGELMAYRHCGFWQPMDTLREKTYLEDLWASGQAPWKKW